METFADLGMPFSLFLAPVAHAAVDAKGLCSVCGRQTPIRFAETCYGCFREGKSKHVIDTEFGMVRAEDAEQGWTHGIPMGNPAESLPFEVSPHPIDPNFPDETWYHVHVPKVHLHQLLRTPTYHTWQGERWLFCCRQPMVFRGMLPGRLFASDKDLIASFSDFLASPRWRETISDDFGHTYYLFTCNECGRLRYHDDCD